MKRFFIILSVFLFFIQAISFAQDTWSLEDCINYALENNLTIKRQQIQSQIAENKYNQSRFEYLPDLNGFVNHNLSSGKTVNYDKYEYVDQTFQDGNLGLQSNVTLFSGLQNRNAMKMNHFSLLAGLQEVEKTKRNISMNIAAGFLDILLSNELLQVKKNQYETTLLQIEKTKKLVEVGNAAKGDLLEMQAQAARENTDITNASNNVKMATLTLAQMLELDNEALKNFQVKLPEKLSIDEGQILYSADSVYLTAAEEMPEIKSAEYQMKSSEKGLDVARGMRSPEISLRGLYYSRYSEIATRPLQPDASYPYIDQIGDNEYKQLTLTLSIPLFNKYKTQTAINNAKLNLRDAQYALKQSKQVLFRDIQQAYADAKAALDVFKSQTESVKYNKESFKYTQQKFDVGLVSSVDYNIAKNNLVKAQSDLIQSKYEYIFKSKILDYYRGVPISLND